MGLQTVEAPGLAQDLDFRPRTQCLIDLVLELERQVNRFAGVSDYCSPDIGGGASAGGYGGKKVGPIQDRTGDLLCVRQKS
jgi:hypothetical protein